MGSELWSPAVDSRGKARISTNLSNLQRIGYLYPYTVKNRPIISSITSTSLPCDLHSRQVVRIFAWLTGED